MVRLKGTIKKKNKKKKKKKKIKRRSKGMDNGSITVDLSTIVQTQKQQN